MTTKDQLAQHTSQISRLEQAMTALAEAQVKPEDDTRELRRSTNQLRRAMAELAKAQAKTEASLTALAEAQTQTKRQFQSYLNTRARN